MIAPLKSGFGNLPAHLRKERISESRLRKHADYQRVYRTGRRQSLPLMTYFFVARTSFSSTEAAQDGNSGPRVGLTTGRVLGNAVERNRIKRRMREAVRRNLILGTLTGPVDVVLHPRRSLLDADFAKVEREVARVFQAVQAARVPVTANNTGDATERDGDAG
ncbi:MAG TPA: ribonuclease P protein component [Acidobacteriaceae bacterium]|jgi:ribonuclease P protein component|nr:ribonuclease P protein component [Acidobacteriaceae bacterium]